jgi:Fe-S-cluster-containing hydrogenase component 2
LIAHYGYEDASGSYFISIDTSKCNSCGECVIACVSGVLAIVDDYGRSIEDNYGRSMVIVKDAHRKRLKYSCAPCKQSKEKGTAPCVVACRTEAITHSW